MRLTRIKVVLICLTAGILASCSLPSRKVEPSQAPPQAKSQLKQIERDAQRIDPRESIRRLQTFVRSHPDTDAFLEAYILKGQLYYDLSDYQNSYRAFISVVDSNYLSPREVEASVGAAKALYKLGRFDEALGLTQRSLRSSSLSQDILTSIYSLRYSILSQTGDRLDALQALTFLASNIDDESTRERFRLRALEFVDSSLTDQELERVALNSRYGFLRPHALYRIGNSSFEQKEYSRAERFLNLARSLAPESDIAYNAEQILQQIEARRRVSPMTVGAVLPLTGRHANVANRTLRGLQLGLGIYGSNPSDFTLAVLDSEGNPDTARRAVERLVIEDSIIALTGDIISRTAEAVAQKADELGVPVIGLSQRAGLTNVGNYVFRNALTSHAQIQELVRSAMEDYGMRRFAVIFPNDPYGIEYTNIFWDEVLKRGGEITAAQQYSSQETDFNNLVQRLIGTFYIETRQSEYEHHLREWYARQRTITSRTRPPDDLLKPIVNFEAVFIPDNVRAMGQLASMLVYHDVRDVRLLGTNLWNNPELISRGTRLVENALFVDVEASMVNNPQYLQFRREFVSVFGEEPSLFEAQGYDTGLLLRELITSGNRSRVALRSSLQRVRRFDATVGTMHVNDSREFTRPLAILTVKDGQIKLAQPKQN